MTKPKTETRISLTEVSPSALQWYVWTTASRNPRSGCMTFHGMIWKNADEWQGSRYNLIGLPEVRAKSKNAVATALVEFDLQERRAA